MFNLTIEWWHFAILSILIVAYGELRVALAQAVLVELYNEAANAHNSLVKERDIIEFRANRTLLSYLVKRKLLRITHDGIIIGNNGNTIDTKLEDIKNG